MCAVAAVALATAIVASAYFSSTGKAGTTFTTATLDAPTITAATPGAGQVSLSWSTVSVPTGLPGTVTYYVTRDGGTPTGCPTAGAPTSVTSCTDTGLSAGSHTYTVTAVWHTWTAASTPTNATLASGAATKLVFTTQPVAGVQAGTTWPTSPVVSVEDAAGNVVTTDTGSVTLAISSGPGAGSLSCTNGGFPTVTAVAGVAKFVNCQINGSGAAGTYTLNATRSGLTATGASSNVVITTGSPNKLVFGTPLPVGNVTEGTPFTKSPIVKVEDGSGNTLTGDTGSVTLQIASGPAGGVLSCSNPGFPTIAAVAGVATFTNCQITGTAAAGTYTLIATRTGITQTPASSAIVINVGAATKLAFSTQPVGNVLEDTDFSTSPVVAVQDAYGNVVTSDTGNVTLAISNGPVGGSLSCTNPAFPTAAAVGGFATFTGCQISGSEAAGTYTLAATRSGLTSTGDSAGVVINVDAPSQLVFTAQPAGGVGEGVAFGTSPVVAVQDPDGNLVTSDVGVVTLAIATGPGAGVLSCSSGTTVAAVAGVATFTGCQITGTAAAGTYTLVATRSGLPSTGSSNNVVITVGAATRLAFTTQPAGGVTEGVALATQPVVAVQDSYGNTVTTDTGNVTLAIASGPGAGALSCTSTTVAAVAGVATFANCQITGTAAAGTYTLNATRSGLTSTGASNNVVITVGAATKLAFTTQPVGGVTEAVVLPTQPIVTVQDFYGNTVTTDTGSVTLAKSSGPSAGVLSCTATTVSAVAGVATFSGCQITGTAAAGTYTLNATRSGLTATGASNNVVITTGVATKLAFTTQPVGGVAEGVSSPRSRSWRYRTPTATPSRPTPGASR